MRRPFRAMLVHVVQILVILNCSNGTNSSNTNDTSRSADVGDNDNGTTIRINSVRPQRIFMNNDNANDATFVTNVNKYGLEKKITKQTRYPNFGSINEQYEHRIGQPSQAPSFNINFRNDDQFGNEYLQEIGKYPSINNTNPDINNIKFNNFEKMVKDKTPIDLDAFT